MSHSVNNLLLGGHVNWHFVVGWPREDVVADRVLRSRAVSASRSHQISGIQAASISQILVHAIVEIRVLRSRAVSASRSHQISGIQAASISQILVHALVEIRVLRSRAVSASRSHQFQGYKPHQYPKSSCTHSLKSVSCGVELSPHRDRTNFRIQTVSISQILVHALVEIRVLRSRAVPASRSHQLHGYTPHQYPNCISACATAQEVVHAIVEIHTALRGASSPAAAFWPMSGPSLQQRESHESSLTSCSGQVCTR